MESEMQQPKVKEIEFHQITMVIGDDENDVLDLYTSPLFCSKEHALENLTEYVKVNRHLHDGELDDTTPETIEQEMSDWAFDIEVFFKLNYNTWDIPIIINNN